MLSGGGRGGSVLLVGFVTLSVGSDQQPEQILARE